jgi:predicted O-methyltransferase YrrM
MDTNFWRDIKPEELYQKVASNENCQAVLKTMRTLQPDPVWTAPITQAVESGRIETRCFISWLAGKLQPGNYLEVGIRRGFSMAMVAARSPEVEIYGFDLWARDYAGVPNPGPDFVHAEIEKVGYTKKLHLISGDSHQTLPAFFRSERASTWNRIKLDWAMKHRPSHFELIMIDGDHSLLGAYQDLVDTMPHCAVGGAIVFDDIMPGSLGKESNGADPHGRDNLLGVWHAIQRRFPNFRYFEYLTDPPGIGVALRLE